MQSSSKIMYSIGKAINIIEIVFSVLILILGIVSIVFAPEIAQKAIESNYDKLNSVSEVKAMAIMLIVAGVISIVITCLVLHFANRAKRSLIADPKNSNAHVIMLVIGVFGDIFYFLGGLFGLLASNQASSSQSNE